MSRVRSDKKFTVKVWVPEITKDIFRSHCFEYHLSMMFVGEQFLIKALSDFDDDMLKEIIEKRLLSFTNMKDSGKDYKPLGINLQNHLWQKLAYFAVYYNTSIAKVGSCVFDFCLGDYQLRKVFGDEGIHVPKKKRKKGTTYREMEKRISDY